MALFFEWNESKASISFKKHGVSFEEVTTVFGDTLSITVSDPLHSIDEDRFIIIGHSHKNRLVVVVHTDRGDKIRIISARLATKGEGIFMKGNKKKNGSDMLSEYDFSGGVRGKYAKRYQEGSNVIVLDRDVAKVFHDRDSVNRALRALVGIIHHQVQ